MFNDTRGGILRLTERRRRRNEHDWNIGNLDNGRQLRGAFTVFARSSAFLCSGKSNGALSCLLCQTGRPIVDHNYYYYYCCLREQVILSWTRMNGFSYADESSRDSSSSPLLLMLLLPFIAPFALRDLKFFAFA